MSVVGWSCQKRHGSCYSSTYAIGPSCSNSIPHPFTHHGVVHFMNRSRWVSPPHLSIEVLVNWKGEKTNHSKVTNLQNINGKTWPGWKSKAKTSGHPFQDMLKVMVYLLYWLLRDMWHMCVVAQYFICVCQKQWRLLFLKCSIHTEWHTLLLGHSSSSSWL